MVVVPRPTSFAPLVSDTCCVCEPGGENSDPVKRECGKLSLLLLLLMLLVGVREPGWESCSEAGDDAISESPSGSVDLILSFLFLFLFLFDFVGCKCV